MGDNKERGSQGKEGFFNAILTKIIHAVLDQGFFFFAVVVNLIHMLTISLEVKNFLHQELNWSLLPSQ